MARLTIYDRLSHDLETYYNQNVERLTKDLAGQAGSRKLTGAERRQMWDSLPDEAPEGQPSKLGEWQAATPEQQQEILTWEREKPGTPGPVTGPLGTGGSYGMGT